MIEFFSCSCVFFLLSVFFLLLLVIFFQRKKITKLKLESSTDYLTGLLNRRHFIKTIDVLLKLILAEKKLVLDNIKGAKKRKKIRIRSRIHSIQMLALCIIDIDFFKEINDTYGHDCGDEVIRFLGENLKNNFRNFDLISRWGGEEFMIAFLNSSTEEAVIKMNNIREELTDSAKIFFAGKLSLTISVGVVSTEEFFEDEKNQPALADSDALLRFLIREADVRLYEAKAGGRNMVVGNSSNKKFLT